eukprot:TRINITY_DN26937_c0_g1_i1.p1 TRINITY_DN26937_c0_g1~~TRINITY_DN26937_c0_g1_i1.p1  ORF type:complete len:507 (-),score=72.09 TRINITY_DN26937_c0_g1_i1:62-1582(-)
METFSSQMFEVVHAVRQLSTVNLDGHADAYLPVQGDIFDGDLELVPFVVTTLLVIILGALAAGAGIGGGGLFVPIFAFIMGVGAKAAVPLSKATILGGALGNMLSIAFARHPDPHKDKPLIDYEASTFMQTGELLGVVFGVLLNMILPEILIIAFLACLLSFNAYKTLWKGITKYCEETLKRSNSNLIADIEEQPKLDSSAMACPIDVPSTHDPCDEQAVYTSDESIGTPKIAREARIAAEIDAVRVEIAPKSKQDVYSLQDILVEDAKQFPAWAWCLTVAMTLYTFVYAWVKKTFLTTCEPIAYWLWYFMPVPVLSSCMLLVAIILKTKHRRREAAGYVFKGDTEQYPDYRDLKWTNETLKLYPLIALLAGVSAGLLGIGGGMVIGPLFINLDMEPKVGASSCAYMILWTATSGVVQYMFAGKLGLQFVAYGILVGFVSGQLGQRGVDHVLRKSGRPSYVIFLLGGIVAVACVAMTSSGVYKLVEGYLEGRPLIEFDVHDFVCRH